MIILGGNKMNYYDNIKQELINNEIYKKVKDYSKNKSDLETYYKVGKILFEAGKHYGESIIREYSKKLTNELGKGYSTTNLKYMRQFYLLFEKSHAMRDQLTWTHYRELLKLKNINEIEYYIKISIEQNLSYRELRNKIKLKEYERLDNKTKEKLIQKQENSIEDYIKNPIIIKNKGYEAISEKLLKQLILEDIPSFLKELGSGFSFIDSEYKIRIGDRYNYIDLLLFNIEFNCYVVIELKITELKKEYIGQIETYMNYIDKNIKSINQDKTIGIIIVRKDNEYIMEYCSDPRIYSKVYELV
ncbi:MAG: DUF1016 domain-containing protein [Lactobacillales bacterium]|nr:DUF1016 domain-containing protein [Lactobacillales bacterium]